MQYFCLFYYSTLLHFEPFISRFRISLPSRVPQFLNSSSMKMFSGFNSAFYFAVTDIQQCKGPDTSGQRLGGINLTEIDFENTCCKH